MKAVNIVLGRTFVLRMLVTICCLTLIVLAHPAYGQNDDPFGSDPFGNDPFGGDPFGKKSGDKGDPFGNGKLEKSKPAEKPEKSEPIESERVKKLKQKREKLDQAQKERKEQFEKLLKIVDRELPKQEAALLLRQVDSWLKELEHSEEDRFDQEIERLELTDQFRQEVDELNKMRSELYGDIDRLKGLQEYLEKELSLHQGTLIEIQRWFAHALEAIEDQEHQNWVLARLKAYPKVARLLMYRPVPINEVEAATQPRELEHALKELITSPQQQQANMAADILSRSLDEFAYSHTTPPITTAPWISVAQPGRDGEQKLIEKLDEMGYYEFIDTPIDEILEYISDLHAVNIVSKKAEWEFVAVSGDEPIEYLEKEVTLRRALQDMLTPLALTFAVRGEVIEITTVEDIEKNPLRRIYDLSEHRLIQEEPADIKSIVEVLEKSIKDEKLTILPVGKRIIVTGSELQHYELAKLLTLLNVGS